MVIGEVILTAIIDAVIGYTLEKGLDRLGGRVQEILGRDPTKKAFKEALGQAFERLRQQHETSSLMTSRRWGVQTG